MIAADCYSRRRSGTAVIALGRSVLEVVRSRREIIHSAAGRELWRWADDSATAVPRCERDEGVAPGSAGCDSRYGHLEGGGWQIAAGSLIRSVAISRCVIDGP